MNRNTSGLVNSSVTVRSVKANMRLNDPTGEQAEKGWIESEKERCGACGERYTPEKMNDDTECKACAWGENQL